MRALTSRIRGSVAALMLAGCAASPAAGWTDRLTAPCAEDCAVSVYGGLYVEDSMEAVLVTNPRAPWSWEFSDDYIIALAASRRVGRVLGLDLEPEIGVARRSGRQSDAEIWAALFLRYRGFPWDGIVTTSVAASTGLNYASGISEVERDRARDDQGSRWMHFFSPEITLALPERPEVELLVRFHHRSGVYGLISEARGGAQYLTTGLRWRF